MNDAAKGVVLSEEVSAALEGGRAVVALETTIVAHGFPPGEGLEIGAVHRQRGDRAGMLHTFVSRKETFGLRR